MARPKKHNADYFSHDKDMRNDPKIKALRRKYPLNGYSVYNMFLEVLTGSDYFVFDPSVLNIELLAGDFDVEPGELEEILQYMERIKLIASEDDGYFSPGLRKRLKPVIDNRIAVKQRFLDKKLKAEEDTKTENTQSKVKYSKVKYSKDIVVEEGEKNLENFSEKNEEVIEPEILDENFKKIEVPLNNPVNEDEMIAAVELLKSHSMFVLIQKQNTIKPPEVLKLFERFYETKHVLGELIGKSKDDVLKNFLFWVPKYRLATKQPQETVKNGTANNYTRRNTGTASSADQKRAERGELVNGLRGLLLGTELK